MSTTTPAQLPNGQGGAALDPDGDRPLAAFPLHRLPPGWARRVGDRASFTGMPPGYAALGLLAAVALAAGRELIAALEDDDRRPEPAQRVVSDTIPRVIAGCGVEAAGKPMTTGLRLTPAWSIPENPRSRADRRRRPAGEPTPERGLHPSRLR